MSGVLAIAAVTAVLKDLLNEGFTANDLGALTGNSVRVTSKPPDLLQTGVNEEVGLNLFLYHTTHNTTLRNNGLPGFDARGDRVANPPLALNLHYLLMAYGREEYQAEIVMGCAMQVLHEAPVLSRAAIRASLSAIPTLAAADLADQIELVKIAPEPLDVDDLSKLWSAFQASHFRLTAAYTASVVLIRSLKSTRRALPVMTSNLYVLPLRHPHIREVVSAASPPADSRITAGSTIIVAGNKLRGDVTQVQIGAVTVTPVDPGDDRIAIDLTAVAGLRAGVQPTQVIHQVLMGDPAPGQPHRGFESNVVPFVLHPVITLPDTHSLAAGTLTVGVTPPVGRGQRVSLYLHEHGAPDSRPPRAYSFPAPSANGITGDETTTSSVAFALDAVTPGAYLACVTVDGAASPLGLANGVFDSPKVTVTA